MKRQFMMLVLAIFAMFACAGIAWAGDGKCYSDSDCGRGVKCRNNKCATAAGGKCYSDSDCGGGKCRSNVCSNSPGGKCYSDSDCGGGKCLNGECSRYTRNHSVEQVLLLLRNLLIVKFDPVPSVYPLYSCYPLMNSLSSLLNSYASSLHGPDPTCTVGHVFPVH